MPLNKTALKTEIVTILTDMLTRKETSIEEFAERLSTSIDDYVKTAKITYTSGLTAPNGPVTGNFIGKLE
jgi:peptide deformylase